MDGGLIEWKEKEIEMNIHLMFSASFFLIFLCGELQKTADFSSHIFFFLLTISGGGKDRNRSGNQRCIRTFVASASALRVSLPLVIREKQTEIRAECMFFFLHLLLLYPCAFSFLLFFWASKPVGTVHPFHNQSFEGELTKNSDRPAVYDAQNGTLRRLL